MKAANAQTEVILRSVCLPYTAPPEEALEEGRKRLRACGLQAAEIDIHKRSVDARKKGDIRFVYSLRALLTGAPDKKQLSRLDASLLEAPPEAPAPGKETAVHRPVVVGFGPGGMFAALTLARAGYRPIVIERGDDPVRRLRQIKSFNETRQLDGESNVQFGAGGAGSFSDGKLVTRVNDPLSSLVLRTFFKFGAPKSVLTLAKPHVGTDNLMKVVKNVESEILRLGGEVRYRTKLTSFERASDGRIVSLGTNNGAIPCSSVVLAIGHSARDTYQMLMDGGFSLVGKDFSVGARIEHLQRDIDLALYGDADISILGHAEYTLSMREGERGVYSFCMCPGGEVICASSEEGGLVVNGMSLYARSGVNANAAIAVSVLKKDYGESPIKAIEYQRLIERRAFEAAGGAYKAPVQTLGDFLKDQTGCAPSRVIPSYGGGKACSLCALGDILPPHVVSLMKKGFLFFEKRIAGFSSPDSVLTGVETRTSAPLRILRKEDLTAVGCSDLYPCGEGAGYAGGITSAAIDGVRCAYAVIGRFAPPQK